MTCLFQRIWISHTVVGVGVGWPRKAGQSGGWRAHLDPMDCICSGFGEKVNIALVGGLFVGGVGAEEGRS